MLILYGLNESTDFERSFEVSERNKSELGKVSQVTDLFCVHFQIMSSPLSSMKLTLSLTE